MKKIILSLLGAFLFGGLGAFAVTTFVFTDDAQFADWYKESVYDLKESGIISGYNDGSFRPNNNVNRAELAVMLDGMSEYFEGALETILFNYSRLDDSSLESGAKVALSLARSGYRSLGENSPFPEQCQDGTLTEIEHEDIPDYFSIFRCDLFTSAYYVNNQYEGGIPESGETVDLNEWYGPFINMSFY